MIFRIFNYLSLKTFFKGIFLDQRKIKKTAEKELRKNSNKKFLHFVGMGRTSLSLILKYLKKNNKKKNEIIVQAYNLPGFLEIIEIEKFKIIFTDIDKKNGIFSIDEILKKINSKTAAVIGTNMFNNYDQLLILKKKLSSKNIPLIEDNSIYFDNFKTKKKKEFSGQLGDYSIFSFNIMKNISAFYGGAVAHNSNEFKKFCEYQIIKFQKFSKILLLKQIFVYFVLKLMGTSLLYRILFFKIVYLANTLNINFLKHIFYPSLKFKKKLQKKYLYYNLSSLSKKLIYLQLSNKSERKNNFIKRKKNNMYLYNHLIKISHKFKKTRLLTINDSNYQNFLDFPLLVDDKNKFVNYMFKNNTEVRKFHYYNCEKIFSKKSSCKNSEFFEKNLICVPSHPQITKKYLDHVITKIKEYNF